VVDEVNVGIIGAGTVSRQYLETFARIAAVRLTAVADLDVERAKAAAEPAGGRGMSVDDLLSSDDVDVVVNLTIPAAHVEIDRRAIAAGKSVYSEKPLALTVADAVQLIEEAAAAGVRLGCAPDTVLGTGTQTARRAIDDGLIGRPVAASATMLIPGHEYWHPHPDFFYLPGAGPLLDRGPYEITALVTMLGPVIEVIGLSSRPFGTRTIRSGPRTGESFPVEVDTHVTGSLRHASGAISTIIMSFDAVATRASNIEVHGDKASLIAPNPNKFVGDVLVKELSDTDWRVLEPNAGYLDGARGYGIADLISTAPGRERAGGPLAAHVLDIQLSVLTSAERRQAVMPVTTCERPDPVPLSAVPGGLRG